MVFICHHTLFFSISFFEQTLGCCGAFALQTLTHFGVALTKIADMSTFKISVIRIGGNINQAQIYAQNVFKIGFRWFWDFYNHAQIKLTLAINQIRLASLAIGRKLTCMIAAKDHWNHLSSVKTQQGNCFESLKAKATGVIHNRPGGSEGGDRSLFLFSIGLDGLNGLGDGPNRQLSPQLVILTNLAVQAFLKFKLVKNLVLKSKNSKLIASLIKGVHGSEQNLSLLRGWKQFNLQGFKHVLSITFIDVFYQYKGDAEGQGNVRPAPESLSLPAINGEASRELR
jgi:hypothetical protein